jgi:hypothetical protein
VEDPAKVSAPASTVSKHSGDCDVGWPGGIVHEQDGNRGLFTPQPEYIQSCAMKWPGPAGTGRGLVEKPASPTPMLLTFELLYVFWMCE